MIHFIALFPKSVDLGVVEKSVSELKESIKQAPGLDTLHVSKGDLMSPAGPPSYSRVLEASFDSLENFIGWVVSPWVQSPEAEADKDFLIENGAILIFYEVN